MASFTDIIPKFNPYVQQLPVEAMVKVGVSKQQAYEQNVTKIQSEIDNIAGLDIMRDVDRNYLQSKMNELGNNLAKFAAADFSNFQLTNSVAGMTKQLVRDDTIKTAVSSTAWARKQKEKIEKGKSDGTWSIENEDLYNEQYSRWINGTKAGESFSSEYVPYRDVYKKLREIAKDVGVDENLVQNLFNPNGTVNKVMIETYSKGKDPNKIYEAFVNGLDQSDYRQLAITGRYKYKGYTNEQLGEILESSNDEYTQVANSRRLDLQQQLKQIEQAIPTLKKPEEKKLYEDQKGKIVQAISKIDEQITESNVSLNESKTKLFSGDTDYANSVRSRIHMNKFLGTLSRDFADKSSYVKYAENPLWKANMEEQKFAFDVKYKTARLAIEKAKLEEDRKANKLKEQEIIAYSTPGPMGGGSPATRESVYQAYDGFVKDRQGNYNKLALAAFDNDPKKMEEYVNLAIRGKVKDPQTGELRNQTRDEVIQNIAVQEYTRIASVMNDKTGKYGSAALKLNPVLVEASTQVYKLNDTISGMKAAMDQIEKETMTSFPDAANEATIMKELKPVNIKIAGTDVTLSKNDQLDLMTVLQKSIFQSKEDDRKVKDAQLRLESKYSGIGKHAMKDLMLYGMNQEANSPTWTKRFLSGSPVVAAYDLFSGKGPGEMTPFQKGLSTYNSEKYKEYQTNIDKKYNEVFSGFFPQNLGFIMNEKNRNLVVGKLNTALYQNPLYTEDNRKALLENGSQVMFTSIPNPTGLGGTTYAAVITSKDGVQSEPIPITSDQYTFLAGTNAPDVDISMVLTRAKVNSSPDRSTNMQGIGSWQTSLFPGQTFTNDKGYNIGGMDLIQSTQNPNVFYPMLYVAPAGSSNYQTIPIQSSVSLSQGFNLPSILTDAKLKAMGINF